jgi:hypothetical protein
VGWRAPGLGMRRKKRGDPKAAPCEENDDCCGDLIRLRYLAGDAELGVHDGDIFRRVLERWVFRRLEPLKGELAVLNPFDRGHPEAVEFPRRSKRGQEP